MRRKIFVNCVLALTGSLCLAYGQTAQPNPQRNEPARPADKSLYEATLDALFNQASRSTPSTKVLLKVRFLTAFEPECQLVLHMPTQAEGVLSRSCATGSLDAAVQDYLGKQPSVKLDTAVAQISKGIAIKTDRMTISRDEARAMIDAFLAAASRAIAEAKPSESDTVKVYLDGTRYEIRYEDDKLDLRLTLQSANIARYPSPGPEDGFLVRWLRTWYRELSSQ